MVNFRQRIPIMIIEFGEGHRVVWGGPQMTDTLVCKFNN